MNFYFNKTNQAPSTQPSVLTNRMWQRAFTIRRKSTEITKRMRRGVRLFTFNEQQGIASKFVCDVIVDISIFGEKIFEFGAKTSALVPVFSRRQTSGVVVKLNRFVNRSWNLDLDLLVRFVGPEPLALDRDHLFL